MKHGVSLDITPPQFGGTSPYRRSVSTFQFRRGETLLLHFQPTDEDLHTLEAFELTSPLPSSHIRRLTKRSVPGDIPLDEWQKCLAFAPLETIHRTFEATTQHYMRLECENRAVPRDHYKSRVPGLRYPRQTKKWPRIHFFLQFVPTVVTPALNSSTASNLTAGRSSPSRLSHTMGLLSKIISARSVFPM